MTGDQGQGGTGVHLIKRKEDTMCLMRRKEQEEVVEIGIGRGEDHPAEVHREAGGERNCLKTGRRDHLEKGEEDIQLDSAEDGAHLETREEGHYQKIGGEELQLDAGGYVVHLQTGEEAHQKKIWREELQLFVVGDGVHLETGEEENHLLIGGVETGATEESVVQLETREEGHHMKTLGEEN